MALEPSYSACDLTLYELARDNDGSSRLCNSLRAASLENRLPFQTVAEYLASPSPVEVLRRNIKSMGRRTAMELDRLVRDLMPTEAGRTDGETADLTLVELALAETQAELAQTTLRALLRHLPPGTRLSRVLASSVGSLLATQAIGDPAMLRTEALDVTSIGLGTVNQLAIEVRLGVSKLIREAGRPPALHDALMTALFGDAAGPFWRIGEPPVPPVASAHAIVIQALGDIDCASAFADAVMPARLARIAVSKTFGEVSMAEVLIDREQFVRKLTRLPNVGRGTIHEFFDACWQRLAVALKQRGVSDMERSVIATALDVDPLRLVARAPDPAERFLRAGSNEEAEDHVDRPYDLTGVLGLMLGRERPQDVAVIRRRFGLDGGVGETLEEIGIDLGVTRERVRQLEKRALAGMASRSVRFGLRDALDSGWQRAWETLADGDDLVTDKEFATFRRTVPGDIKLGLASLGLDLADWLSNISHRYPHGWLAPHRDREPVDDTVAAIDALSRSRPLPRAIRDLGLSGSPPDIEAALIVGRNHRVLHGYMVVGHIGTRRRRSLVAHAILFGARIPMPLLDLLLAYRKAVPSDRCSARDLTIVMSDTPHLFLEVSDGLWFALGIGGEIPPGGRRREEDAKEEDDGEAEPSQQDVTVASAIRDELERKGPQSLSALIDNPRRYLPRDRSPNSVPPILLTRLDLFARVLPNVYALWPQVPSGEDVLCGDLPYLLNETQARIFAMARRAGEPWGSFPLWSPEAEYRLCRWAVREGSPTVRRSLLAMATVDGWPLEIDERMRWQRTCSREGRYDLLANLKASVFVTRPDLDRVLAALTALETAGRTSWMTLNRIDGRHVASQLGCGLLAVLTLCGAVIAPDRNAESAWQLPHDAVHDVTRELRSALASELHDRGELAWSSEAGRLVAARVLNGGKRAPGWLPFRRFSELFRELKPESSEPIEVSVEAAGEIGRALLAERRMADLLEWLDAR